MCRFLGRMAIVCLVGVSSLALPGKGKAASVTLSPDGGAGLGTAIASGGGTILNFTLPNDFASLNSIEFDFSYSTDSAVGLPSLGTASLEAILGLDSSVSPNTAFGVAGVYGVGPSSPGNYGSGTLGVGASSFNFSLPLFGSIANLVNLPATAPLLIAGSPVSFVFYNGSDGGFSNFNITVDSATLKLNYNSTTGGVVPEPSTLAIALVGLAGWRGRRMLRRN